MGTYSQALSKGGACIVKTAIDDRHGIVPEDGSYGGFGLCVPFPSFYG
ncbi:MAG: hypothetical protein MRJ68_21980 [Nitrospira sp.]|nr:hypothetical protein [Nitrospira sp.]